MFFVPPLYFMMLFGSAYPGESLTPGRRYAQDGVRTQDGVLGCNAFAFQANPMDSAPGHRPGTTTKPNGEHPASCPNGATDPSPGHRPGTTTKTQRRTPCPQPQRGGGPIPRASPWDSPRNKSPSSPCFFKKNP